MNKEIKILAAPLQGFTETAWRKAHSAVFGGIDQYYTPFVRLEKGDLRNKDKREVASVDDLTIPQLIASEPEELRFLAGYLVSLGYSQIDVNMGCPFPLIVNRGKGSGILPSPDKVEALLRCMEEPQYVNNGVKFSIKMRLGLTDSNEWRQLAGMINDSAVNRIVLHPRIGKQQYKGTVDMDTFGEFYSAIRKPLVYNGDISSIDDIKKIESLFPDIEGIMIGRGLLADGSLAADFKSGRKSDTAELFRRTKEMHSLMFDYYSNTIEGGDAQLLQKLKSQWEYWLPGLDKKKRKAIMKASRLDAYIREVDSIV